MALEVIRPGSPAYESARKPAIARFHDVRPAVVARCGSPAEVADALELARASGLAVAARSGGHCFAGRSSTEGVVIDVTPMGAVSVADGVASVGAGARLGAVYDAMVEHGVTIPAGCGPDVGVAGLTLGGGLGILGRRHGLTCDSLLGAQVVLADGSVVDCDDRNHEDLFWALRGGGTVGLGVVTSLTFRTVAPPPTTAFHLQWPFTQAAAVAEAWQGWAPVAPGELAASLLITAAADPAEEPVANVFGAMLDGEPAAQEQLAGLVARVGSEPSLAFTRYGSFREAKHQLVQLGLGDERPGAHAYSKSEYFRAPLPAEPIAALLDRLARGRSPGESRELDFTPWGGAYNAVPADATAFPHRSELLLLKQAAVVAGEASGEEREHARAWLAGSWETVHLWGAGGVYPNFPDPDLEDERRAYYSTNRERLAVVKERYDPRGVFVS